MKYLYFSKIWWKPAKRPKKNGGNRQNGRKDLVETGKKYYEIDFVIADKHKISPIEVKSSGYKSHKSLDEFCVKYSDRIMNKYVIYTKDYKRENGIDYIPIYMTSFL